MLSNERIDFKTDSSLSNPLVKSLANPHTGRFVIDDSGRNNDLDMQQIGCSAKSGGPSSS